MYLKSVNLHYRTKSLLVCFLWLCVTLGHSQSSNEGNSLRADRYVYFNAGALINIPSGIQIGIEQRLHKNWFLDLEGGILLFSENPTLVDFNAKNRKGIRFQTGAKVLLTEHFFMGPQFLYKRVTMEEQEWLWRFENTYQQRFDTKRTRRTYAFAADFGWLFDSFNSPIAIEINYALGVQNFNVKYDDILPPDVSYSELTNLGTRPGTSILPFFNYRIKIKYALDYKRDKKAKK